MSTPLTRIELDIATALGCQHPDCKDPFCDNLLYLKGRCHPAAGTWATYKNGTGVIRITCKVCEREVTAFQVAES